MLRVADLCVRYGSIEALRGISIQVPEGQIVALIGANGAGKSTVLRAICGLTEVRSGSIELNGEAIVGKPPHSIVRKGIAMVPEGRRMFPGLTVIENLRMGAFTRRDRVEFGRNLEMVLGLFPVLKQRLAQRAGSLSGGEQQMVALSRALMSSPELILMDEPSLGLAPMLVRSVFQIIQQIHEMGRTVLLAEQNARGALKLADYVYVLETGRVAMEGTKAAIEQSEDVRRAYLGVA